MPLEYEALRSVELRITAQEQKLVELSSDILFLKEQRDSDNEDIKQYIEFVRGFKLGLKILRHIQIMAIWIASVAGGTGIVWIIWKYAVGQAVLGK